MSEIFAPAKERRPGYENVALHLLFVKGAITIVGMLVRDVSTSELATEKLTMSYNFKTNEQIKLVIYVKETCSW